MGPDTIAPTVISSLRANPSPTAASNVDFTITFSESVTGVNLVPPFSDFDLNITGVTGASISAVSGSGASYTVTVSTGSGDGTIQLRVVDDDTIKDTANNPLGGVGTGNGNYASGETYTILKTIRVDTTGVFRPSNGLLFLKNHNDTGIADYALNYGLPGDYPVVGDWDGNGTTTIGIYRDGHFYLKNANTLGFAEIVFAFGQPGDRSPATGTATAWTPSGCSVLRMGNSNCGTAMMPVRRT
jgi:hypothetical protein